MRELYVFFMILLVTDVYGLKVEDFTHDTYSSTFKVADGNILSSLTLIDGSLNSSNYFFLKVSVPLTSLNLVNDTANMTTSFYIKVSAPLSSLNVRTFNHSSLFNEVILNVTNVNITKRISNNSKLYLDFIKSINTSLEIVVGKNSFDSFLMDKYGVGVKNGFVKYKDKVGFYPFNGIVLSANVSGVRRIFVYGNNIEGEVSALRYLKNHKDEFIYFDNSVYLNDIDALSVYDYMHLSENQKWYGKDVKEFRVIVNKSLFGKFEERIIDVKTNDGVLLRVLKLEPKNSLKIRDYRNNITLPLVFARGLWSNLYSWESFGGEMADSGRDVYLIEITGGPGQDCNNCVNYDFNDLINNYWPALIGTVQTLNNGSAVQYVGHSNGARTGISSLEIYNSIGKNNTGSYFNNGTWINVSMTPYPVKTFIAAGIPGAFEGANPVASIINDKGEKIQLKLVENNLTHITLFQLGEFGLTAIKSASESIDDKLSVNLWNNYYLWISSENDTQPGANVNLSNFLIIQGTGLVSSDGIVTTKDEASIYSNIISKNKAYVSLPAFHTGVADSQTSKRIINSFVSSNNLDSLKIGNGTYYQKIYGGVILNETR